MTTPTTPNGSDIEKLPEVRISIDMGDDKDKPVISLAKKEAYGTIKIIAYEPVSDELAAWLQTEEEKQYLCTYCFRKIKALANTSPSSHD